MIGCRDREIPPAVGHRQTRLTAQALGVAAVRTVSCANIVQSAIIKGDEVMKIAVSSYGQDLDAQFDPHFGDVVIF